MELPSKRQRDDAIKVMMDEKGRLIDEKGRELNVSATQKFSLDINKQKYEKKKKKNNKYLQSTKTSTTPRGYFYDKNIPKKKEKKALGFNFNNTTEPIRLIANVTPTIEWWDKELTDSYDAPFNLDLITSETFTPILPTTQPLNTTTHQVTIHLTPQEKKKLKRLKKAKKLEEMREKIKIGLIEPPPQKIKLATFMKLMSKELAQDPTKTEQEIMKKYNERLKNHIQRNEDNKLTHSQRVERELRRLRRDSARESRTAVFRTDYFSSTKIKFKLMKNAQQLALVGVCLILPSPKPGVIIIEGGKRAVKFFTRLCLHRIDWKADNSSCNLVWDAEIKDAKFFKFKVMNCESEIDVKRILEKKNILNYWDLANNWKSPSNLI